MSDDVTLTGEQTENAEDQKINSSEPLDDQTIKNNGPPEITSNTSASAVSLTSKVSGGKISNWIHKSKKKEKFEEGPNIANILPPQTKRSTTCSSSYSEYDEGKSTLQAPLINTNEAIKSSVHSKGRIAVRRSKINFNKKDATGEESEVLLAKTKTYRRSPWFFKKFKNRSGTRQKSIGSSVAESLSSERATCVLSPSSQSGTQVDLFDAKYEKEENMLLNRTNTNNCIRSCSSFNVPHFRRSFLISTHFELDIQLSDALRDVIELTSQLRDDQAHIAHLITKFIQDRALQKELLDAVSNYAKLHLEAERRAQNLANEIWLQQSEMMKNQEVELKENLNLLVKENRKFREDIDNLTRRNEKLAIKLNQFPDRRGSRDSSNQLLDNLNHNNDKLRHKTGVLLNHIEEQEKEIHTMQQKIQSIEQQLKNATSQVHNYKAVLRRMETDHEVEYAHLSQQLQTNQITIKESVEAGDVLLEDMDGLKRQLKLMPCSLNWTKLKSRGNSLPDLIYMCRSCINELVKEIVASQTDILLKDKDNTTLREELLKMQMTLDSAKSEQERLNNQLDATKEQELSLKSANSKYEELEREFNEYKETTSKLIENLEKEKSSLAASFEDMDVLNRQVIEKEEELSFNKEKISEYKSENDTLRMQIHGLKQVLNASGTGDVARELADTQEKLTLFQSQYYQLLSEKNYLVEQLQSANAERGALNEFQNTYYQFIQSQQHNLEVLTKENSGLKQQIENERSRTSALRSERNKLREEKAILREIYYQLKNEINKVEKLEGEVAGMNIEANRLAIIAEYNKQLGEKLQCEVAERDEKISKLESSMEELNVAQMENVKDKVALCVELNEVCSINDKLNHSLANELQKSVHLDKTKKKIEDAAKSQLKAIEEMQTAERAALRELLTDYKNIVMQRDNLLASQNEYLQQIADLRNTAITQGKSLECTQVEQLQSREIISNLEEKLKHTNEEFDKIHQALIQQTNCNMQQKNELEQLKGQKETLESSIDYLKNTMQKLYNELNECKKKEVEATLSLEKQTQRCQELQNTLEQRETILVNASQENHNLAHQISAFNQAYEELLSKYQENMEKATVTNEELTKDLEETKIILEKQTTDIERLENAYADKEMEVIEMQRCCDGLTEQLKQLETSTEDIDLQSKLLSESNSVQVHLQETLNALRCEHAHCLQAISALTKEKQNLKEKLKNQTAEMEAQCLYYKEHVETTIRDYADQRNEMQKDLQNLSLKLELVNEEYINEKTIHAKLLESYKDLATKLLTAIRMLVNEKLNRPVEASITEVFQKNRLSSEKVATENTIVLLITELKELRSRFEELTNDKKSVQSLLVDLQQLQKQNQSMVQQSEQAIHGLKVDPYSSATFILKDTKSKLEEQHRQLQNELEASHRKITELNIEISNLKQELTIMEFQKSEVTLRLHETQVKLETEQNINKELMETNQKVIAEVLNLENTGRITLPIPESLLNLVQGYERDNYEVEE